MEVDYKKRARIFGYITLILFLSDIAFIIYYMPEYLHAIEDNPDPATEFAYLAMTFLLSTLMVSFFLAFLFNSGKKKVGLVLLWLGIIGVLSLIIFGFLLDL